MEEIGKFLKDNRLKQKKTIADISDITKMNTTIIENIETGNVAYFSNDLTYLRYYVRSYANAVNVDFDSLEAQLSKSTLDYTQSISIIEDEKINDLNENIKVKRQQRGNAPKSNKLETVRGSVDVDWTLVSLIAIVTLIAGFLIYSITVNVLNKDDTDKTPPIVDTNPDEEEPDEEEPDKEPEPIIQEVVISKEDPITYLISNWDKQKDFSIKTAFGVNTWVQVTVNDQVVNIPGEKNNSKTFTTGEELVIKDKYTINAEEKEFAAGDVIKVRYGIMRGNKFLINDEDYKLDESIADANGGTDVVFKLDTDVN